MKRGLFFVILIGIYGILSGPAATCFAQDKNEKQVKAEDFVPSPVFSPPYPSLPHHFTDIHTIQILCRAPKGAIEKALAPPLETVGEADTFILLMAWTPDVEKQGFNVHEIAINVPVKWNGKIGNTTVIEYIDSDMGLIAGREIYGWPKKMAEITWTKTRTGWIVVANKMKDQGNLPLMKVEYKISESTPEVKWPDMGPVLLVRRVPPASASTKSFNQIVCVGCNMPQRDAGPLEAQAGQNDTRGFATVNFFDGPHDPLTFLGPLKVLDAKMSIMEGDSPFGLGLGEVLSEWRE